MGINENLRTLSRRHSITTSNEAEYCICVFLLLSDKMETEANFLLKFTALFYMITIAAQGP